MHQPCPHPPVLPPIYIASKWNLCASWSLSILSSLLSFQYKPRMMAVIKPQVPVNAAALSKINLLGVTKS